MKEITDLQRKILKKYNVDAMVNMTPENITYLRHRRLHPHAGHGPQPQGHPHHHREARPCRHRCEH